MRKLKKQCLAFAALLPLAGSAASTLAGTVLMTKSGPGGKIYQVIADPTATWGGAESDARTRGAFLVTIGNGAEQSFVQGLLSDARAPSGSYWFGLRETPTAGDFRNVASGLVPTYTHWFGGSNQPDNFAGKQQTDNAAANENSGSVLWSNAGDPTLARAGFWNDLPNSGGYPQVQSVYPDLVSRGYLLEFQGVGSGNGVGGGSPGAAPLPAALWMFPAGAVVAAAAARRLRRG